MITYAKRLPERGETVEGDSFALGFGGKGANQAVMASRFGVKVYLVNTLGDDIFGDSTIKNFLDQGIDTSYLARAHGASGVAPIWVEPDGTNRIIIVPGANNAMTEAQAVRAIESIPNIGVVVGQLEIPQRVTAAAFRTASAMGITTVLNPAPSAPLLPELLEATDWIIPNEHEFADFHPEHLYPSSDEVIKDFVKLLNKKVVVTLGEAGAVLCRPDSEVLRVAAPKVQAIDSTGAGDSFVGAFAYGIALGLSDQACLALGCDTASDSVKRKGTQSSYPSRERAHELLNQTLANFER